ncbi:MAG: PAS domain S-box protein [Cyclobacteriaceae bacterium]
MPHKPTTTARREDAASTDFSEEELRQLRQYACCHDELHEKINKKLRQRLRNHPVLGDIIVNQSAQEQAAQQAESQRFQYEAIFQGKWDAYAAHLGNQGVMYAKLNLEFEDWLMIVRLFKKVLMDLLLEKGESTATLFEILRGADTLSDFALSVIADSYMDEKERLLRQERDEKDRLLKEVEQAKQRLNAIVQNSSDHIFVIDPLGRIQSINHVADGYSLEEIVGANLFDLQTDENREMVEKIIRGVFQKGKSSLYDVDLETEVGLKRFANSVGPIKDAAGNITAAVIVSRDITHRMKAEQALHNTLNELKAIQERFDLAIEGSSAGIWDWDLRTDVVYFSSRFKSLIGFEDHEIENRFSSFDRLLHPEDKKMVFEKLSETLNDDIDFDVEYRLLTKPGKYRWFIARGKVLRDHEGVAFRMAGSISNIDAQKGLQDQLTELNANLEKKVEERTARLNEINKELEGFSYTVSHDLRAPLRAIDGFSKILTSKLEGSIDKNQRHYLDIIIENVRRMGNLIDDLLAFSRVGRKDRQIMEFSIGELANEVMGELHQSYPKQSIDFQNHAKVKVHGDRTMLKIALSNLLENALKFSATKSTSTILFRHDAKKTMHFFSITDNGVGFESAYANKLFQIFQRLHTNEEFEGTGVGLAIVQRIVQRHGGSVSGEALKEGGARFTFTLPITQPNENY